MQKNTAYYITETGNPKQAPNFPCFNSPFS